MYEKRKKDSVVGTLYGRPYAKNSFLGRLKTGEAQSTHDKGLQRVLDSAEHRLGLRDFLVFEDDRISAVNATRERSRNSHREATEGF